MISKEEVQHIAKLARLKLTKSEEEKFSKELSLVLDYIEKLKEVDIEGIKPTSHPFEIENETREDIYLGKDEKVIERLKKLFPSLEKGYLKVKKVLTPPEH